MNRRPIAILVVGVSLGLAGGAFLGYFLRGLREAPSAAEEGLAGAGKGARRAAAGAIIPPETPAARPQAMEIRAGDGPAGAVRSRPSDSPSLDGRPKKDLLEILLAAARSHDSQRFWLAAGALGPLEPDQALRIAATLREEQKNPKAAELLFGELMKFGGKDGLDRFAEILNDDQLDRRIREIGIEVLGDIAPERRGEAIPILQELLKSGLPFEYTDGAKVLGRLLGPEAVSGLIEVVDFWAAKPSDPSNRERIWWRVLLILDAVAEFATPEDRERLLDLFNRPLDRGIQALLCRILAEAAGVNGAATMLDLLEKPPQGAIREVIAEALGKAAKPEDLPRLRAALQAEEEPRVQAKLAAILARLAGTDEIDQLAKQSLDPGASLSLDAVAKALSSAGKRELAPLMLQLLPSARSPESLSRLAEGVLDLLGREEGSEKLLAIVAEARTYPMASGVARALLESDPEHDPRRLAALLDRFNDGVSRAAIADVLMDDRREHPDRRGSGEIIPALARVLSSEEDAIAQQHLAGAIASYGPEGERMLGELLASDEDPRRRLEVLRSLELLPPQESLPLARRVFDQDPSPELRREAVKILGRSQDPALLQDLFSSLATEEDPAVRKAIREVVERNGAR